jgi:hypothetical protein
VLGLAVIAEAFSVIGHEDDDRLVIDADALQRVDEFADDAIGRRG